MKITLFWAAALFAAGAHAEAVSVSATGASESAARANTEAQFYAQYPQGRFNGISACRDVSYWAGMSQWVCYGSGDDGVPQRVTVETQARARMAHEACALAVSDWNARYGARGAVESTSVVAEGNSNWGYPSGFVCYARGRITP